MNKIQQNDPHQESSKNVLSTTDAAIKSLCDNKNIIIKKADKGGGICVLDNTTTFYAYTMNTLRTSTHTD